MLPNRKYPSARISNWPQRVLLCAALFANVLFANALLAETVDLYFDSSVPQISFAADEVRAALTKQGHSPANKALTALPSGAFANKSVVIGLKANLTTALTNDGGSSAGLPSGEQAYGLRTTTKSQQVYWVIGADKNGAMYGGITLSEKIGDNNLAGSYHEEESPYILKRGVKYNLPLDRKCPTYFAGGEESDAQMWEGTSAQKAIPHVWDIDYWHEWFDEMARARFNVLSLWNCHPFPAMLDIPEAFANVEFYGSGGLTMTKVQKTQFWQDVMAYGKSRGFDITFITWNIYTFGAVDPSNVLSNSDNDTQTKDYHYRAVKRMLELYPDLDGIGVAAGENMDGANSTEKEQWLMDTYGQAIYDHMSLPANAGRKFTFIHRTIQTSFSTVLSQFQNLISLPNVKFDLSYKYSSAHMYSTTTPDFISGTIDDLDAEGNVYKTWLEVRNDDYYFLQFGDPQYARDYIGNWPNKDKYIAGFMYGSDGWVPTRDFSSKSSVFNGMLEIKRNWLSQKIWGKLTYNPNTPDSFFINEMKRRWPGIDANKLFAAWQIASRALPLSTEIVGNWKFDYTWWPELCERDSGFKNVSSWKNSSPISGSNMISIPDTAAGTTGPNDAFHVADKIENLADAAAATFNTLTNPSNYADLDLVMKNIKAQIYLNYFYAGKIRGTTYDIKNNVTQTKAALNLSRSGWFGYTNIMDELYYGSDMVRVASFNNWHVHDGKVTSDYTTNGGNSSDPLVDLFANTTPNNPPTVATPASASPNPATGTSVALTVLGADEDANSLMYNWNATTAPASVNYSTNGTNAARNTTATFSKAGNYSFQVTITDNGGLSVTSSIAVTVSATLTNVTVTPSSTTVAPLASTQFTAVARDQFNTALASQPAFTWSVSGGGTVSSGGNFTAGSTPGGPHTLTVNSGGKSATASITVGAATAQTTYGNGGLPWSIPTTGSTQIEFENYDSDGAEIAYLDGTVGNSGGAYRTDDVDIGALGSGYNIKDGAKNEWLEYTCSVASAGTYQLEIRYARNNTSGLSAFMHCEVGGINVSGPIECMPTGGWNTYQNKTVNITLAAGNQEVRFVYDNNGINLDYFRLSLAGGGIDDLIAADFNVDSNGFTYEDDAFSGYNGVNPATPHPAYASGTRDSSGGSDGGGCLSVIVGGIDPSDITNISGAWSKNFSLANSSTISLALSYRLNMGINYDAGEFIYVIAEVDGVRHLIATLEGGGTINWTSTIVNLGALSGGTHSVKIGAYNNAKTATDESATISFDQVQTTIVGSG